jgi:MFS family permease
MLYVFAIPSLKIEFGLTNAEAGLVMAFTMVASAIGGVGAGVLADRFGRRPILILTILTYSLASAGSATSSGLASLLFWRFLIGLGLGGEWASGSVLVAEFWPAEKRGRAIGFMQSGFAVGYMMAAGVSALILPRFGWRALFLVGVLPALLTLAIRRKLEEPPVWERRAASPGFSRLFSGQLGQTTFAATALTTAVLFGYWGLFTWLPSFLATPAQAGGAGLTLVRSSAWMIAVNCGALGGYWTFGYLADRIGRRPAFLIYVLAAAVLIPIYGTRPSLALAPLIGWFGSGYFSLFGAMLAELYPTAIRATGQGFTYNFGRALAALAPWTVGAFADRTGLGAALALNSGFFLCAAALVFLLPETKGRTLE